MNEQKNVIDTIVKTQHQTLKFIDKDIKSWTEIIGVMNDSIEKMLKIINYLLRFSMFVMFVLSILVWKVFFHDMFSNFISIFFKWWPNLSDAWQIFIIGIPTYIITHVIGSLLVKKVNKSFLKKNK